MYKEYTDRNDARYRDEWERMRLFANIVIQPHLVNKVPPEKMLPLPWDKDRGTPEKETRAVSKEEALARFKKRMEKKGS